MVSRTKRNLTSKSMRKNNRAVDDEITWVSDFRVETKQLSRLIIDSVENVKDLIRGSVHHSRTCSCGILQVHFHFLLTFVRNRLIFGINSTGFPVIITVMRIIDVRANNVLFRVYLLSNE